MYARASIEGKEEGGHKHTFTGHWHALAGSRAEGAVGGISSGMGSVITCGTYNEESDRYAWQPESGSSNPELNSACARAYTRNTYKTDNLEGKVREKRKITRWARTSEPWADFGAYSPL